MASAHDSRALVWLLAGDSSSLVDKNVYGQRLREMFQERVRLFRDAVYQLTGFMATLKTEREVTTTTTTKRTTPCLLGSSGG